jgi:uncharacterized protein YndB with AHSA1/START domain
MFGSKKSRSAASPDEAAVMIAAKPERVYEIVTDIANMGRLSPECTGGKWKGKARKPEVGAVFKGKNRRGPVRWSTKNRVVAAEPGEVFAFETKQSGTRWRYQFTQAAGHTIVTETREPFRNRPLSARVFTALLLGGVKGHDNEMREGMVATLNQLKALAEAPSAERTKRRLLRRRS